MTPKEQCKTCARTHCGWKAVVLRGDKAALKFQAGKWNCDLWHPEGTLRIEHWSRITDEAEAEKIL